MSSRRRAVSVLCWLAIAALLVRIAAGGALERVAHAPNAAAVTAVAVGAALFGLALVAAVALGAGAAWAAALSVVAATVAIAYGLVLVVGGHESGSLVALAGAVAILAAVALRPPGTPPTDLSAPH